MIMLKEWFLNRFGNKEEEVIEEEEEIIPPPIPDTDFNTIKKIR